MPTTLAHVFTGVHLKKEEWYRYILAIVIVFFAFLLTAQVNGYFYREVGTAPATVSAPAGIAIAALLLEGYAIWPAITLAVLVSGLMSGTPLLIVLGATIGNTLQALAAYFFLRATDFDPKFSRVKDMFLLIIVAFGFTLIAPGINSVTAWLYTLVTEIPRDFDWSTWWTGSAMSVLVFTPFFVRWIKYPMTARTRMQTLEILASQLSVIGISIFLFATPNPYIGPISLIYPLLAVMFWISFRMGPRMMFLALFTMTVISMLGALYGTYEMPEGGLSQRIYNAQIFDLIVAFFFFILVSVEEQRKEAVRKANDRTLRLETALEQIRVENQAKNEFIATLAHELRNPLATIMSSVELMGSPQSPQSEVQDMARQSQQQIRTMSRFLDDLLDVARVTRRQLVLRKERVELAPIVRTALATVDHVLKKYEHTVTVALPEQSIVLFADATRLEQALVNLIHNAAKYTPAKGKIEVRGTYQNGWLTLSVIDTGIGIPTDMLSRIFDPFVQIRTQEKLSEGLGIGLSLTKQLIEMHGGTIMAQQRKEGEEKGTAFVIKLPASDTPLREQPKNADTPERTDKFTIIVVDDNPGIADGLAKLLTYRGHTVSTASSGADALKKIAEIRPDVVLLDIGLPDMSGYKVAQEVQRSGADPVLIALTGYGQEEDRQRAHQAGFHHHLTKPVGLADIEIVLEKLVPNKG